MQPVDPLVGSDFGDFRIEAQLGVGGMGVVYQATQLSLGRTVALKLLDPRLAEDDTFRSRFDRESRVTAGLRHRNIITIYAAGEHEGRLYISMEFARSGDLRALLRAGALDGHTAIMVFRQLAEALDAAHEAGLIHRDVTPGNILLDGPSAQPCERILLSDFGLVRRMQSNSGLTLTGQLLGTVDYCSPEQLKGREETTEPISTQRRASSSRCSLGGHHSSVSLGP